MFQLNLDPMQGLPARIGQGHRHTRSRLLTHRIGGVTCMINPRWRGNRAKNYTTLQGNQCFSRFKTSRCLESLRINIFWKRLIIAEVLSTICVISAEFLVKISLVKCVVNWSLGQFGSVCCPKYVFLTGFGLLGVIVTYSYPKLNIYKTMEQDLREQIDCSLDLCGV